MIDYFVFLGIVLLAYMTAWFVISLIVKRNDVADIAWGLGFVLLAWTSFFLSSSNDLRSLIVCLMVSVWGIRLATHVYLRNKGKEEDYRYNAWRKSWGKWFYIRSYLQVYFLQGVLLFIIVSPVLLINRGRGGEIGWIDLLGFLIWAIGFFFEVVGDAQLTKFIRDKSNKGKLMMSGLWRYTRHPNYFGEVSLWWGIWIISISTTFGLWAFASPLMITILILRISGIPLLEKKMEEHPDFAQYKKRVSAFFPLPQRK